MRIVKDPVWQFVGVIIGVVAIIVSVILYQIGRPVKRLQVEILSNSPLISVNTDISREIRILYKDRPVQTLSLILLRLNNLGNEPIRESDYSEPIRISISPNAEVGEVTVQETKPGGIDLAPTISARNQIEIAKALLNPGDQAILKVLALNNDGTLKVEARIAGIRDLEVLSVLEGRTQSRDIIPIWVVISVVGVAVILIIAILIWNSRNVIEWRRNRFGFNPARYYYTLAQESMLKAGPDLARIGIAIRYLGQAFSWDKTYVQKALNDPLFSHLKDYEKFKAVIERYKLSESESNDTRQE